MKGFRLAGLALGAMIFPASAGAQIKGVTACDSIIAAARVDSQAVTMYVTSGRVDGAMMSTAQSELLSTAVASALILPNPLRLTVFSGSAQMRVLRRLVDTVAELRVPTVTGVYRFTTTRVKAVAHIETVRSTMMPGFDSAATEAILSASLIKDVAAIPFLQDSMRVEVRISVDSMPASRRVTRAYFPRMRVADAVPFHTNPPPIFPQVEKLDASSRGEVVLRFVVDADGYPSMETVEVVRATTMTFLRSALTVLPAQLFTPARINGCPVAQEIQYPFSFVMPDTLLRRH